MSTFGTMKARVAREMKRGELTACATAVQDSVLSAIQLVQNYRFAFNEGTHTFNMTVGQETYEVETATSEGYASDLVKPLNLYIKVGGTRWLAMLQSSIDQQRWLQPTDSVTGVPTHWAWHNNKIYVTPWPSEENLELRMDYVRNIGIPRYYWDGTAWAFVLEDSNAPMLDTFSNAWITDAEELIRQRSKWDLYYNYYDDDQNAMKMYESMQLAIGNLRTSSENYSSLVRRMPTRV